MSAGYSGEPVSLSDEPINILTPPGKNVTLATVASSIAMVSSFWKGVHYIFVHLHAITDSYPANHFSCDLSDFDLETLRGKLDEEGLQIAENQELSVKKRRELADATRGLPQPRCERL